MDQKFSVICMMLFVVSQSLAQDTLLVNREKLKLSGYTEIYYAFDFNKPADHNRPNFLYSFNRHNEVNWNLGLIRASYENSVVRGNFALMAGTYANANLAHEPAGLKNIFEANLGVKLSRTKELWIDAGIMPSHIGFESAIEADPWTLTRSMLAENSPYYEPGAKLSYTSNNEEWYIAALLLNGWQRINRLEGNSLPSFGTQVTFTATSPQLSSNELQKVLVLLI